MDAGQFTIDVTARGAAIAAEPSHARLAADAYDAIKPAGKRKQPAPSIIREDQHLRGKKRTQLIANAADLKRNFAIAAWMVRKHLDYVARFNFVPATGDRGFDKDLAALMEWQSQPANMDRGGRLTREKFFRLAEARRCLDGDFGMLRLRDGRTQAIKGDLIADPPNKSPRANWESGVQIDKAGAALAYAIHGRTPNGRGTEFQRIVPAENFHLHGFFDDSPGDQTRGISPITAALADFRDVYESFDYIKVKIKLAQLLGLAFTRKAESEELESAMPGPNADPATDPAEPSDEPEPRTIDWSHGVTSFDLDEGEDVKVIESTTPSSETVAFLRLIILVAMKSLDLPFSFFDEKHTNFHGSRGAWLQYERSALDKRDDQLEMRRRWTLWSLQNWVYSGQLVLPRRFATVADIRFAWVPKGMPWWKPSEEVTGALKAIGGGLDNPIRVCQEYDRGDVYGNIDATLDVMAYAKEQGLAKIGEPLRLAFEAEFPTQAPEIIEE